MGVQFRFAAGSILAVLLSACAIPAALPAAHHPPPPIAAFRYIADPVSARIGSPEIVVELPHRSLVAFADETGRAAFRAEGARYRLAEEKRIGFGMYDPVARFPKGIHDPALGDPLRGSPSYSYLYGTSLSG